MVHGPEATVRVVRTVEAGGGNRRVVSHPGPATGLALSMKGPRREDIERRWRSVISGALTREEVHAWSDRLLTTDEAYGADLGSAKGCRSCTSWT